MPIPSETQTLETLISDYQEVKALWRSPQMSEDNPTFDATHAWFCKA